MVPSDSPIQPALAQIELGVGLTVFVQKEDMQVAGHRVHV